MQKLSGNYAPLLRAGAYFFLVWLVVFFLRNWPEFTSYYYPSFYRSFYPFWTGLFGYIPFSVGDILYLVLALLLVWTLILGIRCLFLGQKWRAVRIFSRLIFSLGTFYLLFHVLWAFNYYKPGITGQFEFSEKNPEELKIIADDLFKKALTDRETVKENKAGVFDFGRKEFYNAVPKRLDPADNLQLYYTLLPSRSFKKYSLFSLPMRYFGVAGYYNPFTAEAQITRLIPDTSKPFSMAHEQAHQMGYATESEANFIGFLSCIQSGNKALNYSGNYKALKYVLNEIYPYDSVYVIQKLDSFSPGMQRDRTAEKAYHQRYSGIADESFSAMNNAYLKANNQKEGIESYNRFVDLLVEYYRLEKSSVLQQKISE